MSDALPVFDPHGPLPQGTVVLEASAGTGKTTTIAKLVTRYVADGVAVLDDMLLVTFGRLATQELRERIRVELVGTERRLAADGDRDGRRRVAEALAGFDQAAIATTHTFCHRMLAGLGVTADHDPRAVLVEDAGDLINQVTSDVYLRRYAGTPTRPPMPLQEARQICRQVIGLPDSRLEPRDATPGSADAELVELVTEVAAAVNERKRREQVLSFDDLQLRLRDALADPQRGPRAATLLRTRFRVVMVDEFQDTDPVQWEILNRAFHGHVTLILIGDPKQAIYAFRGGDVVTYLSAVRSAGSKARLATNWRSDPPMVDAVRHLMGDLALGAPEIVVEPVAAARGRSRLTGAGAALRVRVLTRHALTSADADPSAAHRALLVGGVREAIAADLSADVLRLLSGPARWQDDDSPGPAGQGSAGQAARPVRPSDIAVLVHVNRLGALVRDALLAAGVPAVLSGGDSVFAGQAAQDWMVLLGALDDPGHRGRARRVALGPFLGWTAEQLGTATESDLDGLTMTVRSWAGVATGRGMAALLNEVDTRTGLAARMLAGPDGDRRLTDLRHIGQALHVAARDHQLGPAGLLSWLRRRVADSGRDGAERGRRLSSDADAVHITTIHSSKGLEFPVVYLPFVSDRHTSDTPFPLLSHDGDRRVIDIGRGSGAGRADRLRAHVLEQRGEDLRLLYVGLTRACGQVIAWWAPSTTTAASPLHRVLFAEPTLGRELPERAELPTDVAAVTRLRALAATSGGSIAVEPALVGAQPGLPESVASERPVPVGDGGPVHAREFTRSLQVWRRTSYTGLTSVVHATPTSEPDDPLIDDEPVDPDDMLDAIEPVDDQADSIGDAAPAEPALPGAPSPQAATPQAAESLPSPLAGLGSGARFGTLVHSILEQVDPTVTDLPGALTTICTRQVAATGYPVDPVALATGLVPVLTTPLGALTEDLPLTGFPIGDRLCEVTFELPLVGGDLADPTATPVVLARIADLVAAHLPADDPLTGYPDLLRGPGLGGQLLRGYLTGSLDAVLRVRDPDADRFVVIDYKTNLLAPDPGVAQDYRAEAMTQAMLNAHYPLQALLYSVALHRYLRWRVPGYHPARHLAGVGYLFVRGMCGPRTPVLGGMPTGVFGWHPPAALVEALSSLLAGRDVR